MVNFPALVQFLIDPLLDHQQELRIDCESTASRTWLRIAFNPQDKGRVFGKGGRTIQAIRQLVVTAGKLTDHRASLEIYDPEGSTSDSYNSNNNSRRSSQPDFEQQGEFTDQSFQADRSDYRPEHQSELQPDLKTDLKPEPNLDRKIEKPRKPIKLKS
jgi:uncharacterized protein